MFGASLSLPRGAQLYLITPLGEVFETYGIDIFHVSCPLYTRTCILLLLLTPSRYHYLAVSSSSLLAAWNFEASKKYHQFIADNLRHARSTRETAAAQEKRGRWPLRQSASVVPRRVVVSTVRGTTIKICLKNLKLKFRVFFF